MKRWKFIFGVLRDDLMYLGICGPSNSGKTTLICNLLKALKDVKVAVVKHTPHGMKDVLEYIRREIEIERILKKLPNFNCGECMHKNCREMAEAIYRGEDKFENCRYWNPHALIDLKVNGKDIYMGKFAQNVVMNTLLGLLSSFKGVGEVEEVELHLVRKKD